jgi:tetratricopeptide (TPR) repeat protein
LVELVEQAGQQGRARELLKRLTQESPSVAALNKLAKLEEALQNWPDAMAAYRRLLSLEQDAPLEAAAIALADVCEKADRAADARADLERAVERAPESATLRARLRKLYEKIGARDQLARMYLHEASAETDALAQIGAMVNAGALMLESGNAAQAVGVLERAHQQEPAHIQAAALLASALLETGNSDRALAALDETTRRHQKTRSKEVASLHRRIADIHLEADELVEAFDALSAAFALDKGDPELALSLGLLALDLDEHRVAQQALQVVTLTRTNRPDSDISGARAGAYYHLGRLAQAQGDHVKARLMAAKATHEDPDHRQARSLLAELGAN